MIFCYNGDMDPEIVVHGVYRHFKGDCYLVEDVVHHSETKEKMVLYRALYGDGRLWVRPYEMFASEVDHEKYPGVKQKYRFELQEKFDGARPLRRTIAIAGSSKFWREAVEWKMRLENAGYEVVAWPEREGKDWFALYENYWGKLLRADDILVLNLDKRGVKGYIGAESFAELSQMAVRRMRGEDVRIFLHDWPSRKCACYDEIMEMKRLGWVRLWGDR